MQERSLTKFANAKDLVLMKKLLNAETNRQIFQKQDNCL